MMDDGGGQVGGNGSIYWGITHKKDKPADDAKKGARADKSLSGKPPLKLLVASVDADVAAHDRGVDVDEIDTSGRDPNLKGFPKQGHFLVRVRFAGSKGDEVEKWINGAPRSVRSAFTTYLEGNVRIVAINVKAIRRARPKPGKTWSSMPWEIRFDW